MNKLAAILLTFLLILPAQTLAKPWPQSASPANDCAGLARACTGAARELTAARALIAGYESQIIAADLRIQTAKDEIVTLKSIGALEAERAAKLEAVIAAEREAKAALLDKIMLQEKRIAKLEKSAGRWRKFALITGVAAGVAILVGVRQ
jgi:chromosome segregation ATPase